MSRIHSSVSYLLRADLLSIVSKLLEGHFHHAGMSPTIQQTMGLPCSAWGYHAVQGTSMQCRGLPCSAGDFHAAAWKSPAAAWKPPALHGSPLQHCMEVPCTSLVPRPPPQLLSLAATKAVVEAWERGYPALHGSPLYCMEVPCMQGTSMQCRGLPCSTKGFQAMCSTGGFHAVQGASMHARGFHAVQGASTQCMGVPCSACGKSTITCAFI